MLKQDSRAGSSLALVLCAAAALVLGTPGPAMAQEPGKPRMSDRQISAPRFGEWPQWRGVHRDGRVLAPLPTGGWPVRVSQLWASDVGEGYSGPVVSGERVWIHSRRGEKEVVSALLLSSGEVLWSAAYDAPFRQDDNARAHGRGPYATPAVSEGRLFTHGMKGVVSAWDAATGKLLWRTDPGREFGSRFPYFGAAASPLVWEKLCFVHLGGDDRSDGMSPGVGAMVALRVADGREEWRWAGDGPPPGASPMICSIEGSTQLIFKSKQKMVGLDPRTGRELWQFPFKVSQFNTIVTPLMVGEGFVTSDYEFGTGAWRIRSNAGGWNVQPLWKTSDVSLFMSSPVLAGGLVVGFSHYKKGQLFVLDPADGKVLWRGDPRSGEHATLISWENRVLVFREDGWLDIGEISRAGFRSERKFQLGNEICWGHPALVGNRILVRDGTRLTAYELAAR